MERNDPGYFRPLYAWGAAGFAIVFVIAYASSGRLVASLLVAAAAGIAEGLFWYSLLTVGERRAHRRRHVDESRLS